MKVTVEDSMFDVSFRRVGVILVKDRQSGYRFCEVGKQGCSTEGVTSISTVCSIAKVGKDGRRKTLGTGAAVCDTRDQFCRLKGRKKSFAKALTNLTNFMLVDSSRKLLMPSKDIRKNFWNACFNGLVNKKGKKAIADAAERQVKKHAVEERARQKAINDAIDAANATARQERAVEEAEK